MKVVVLEEAEDDLAEIYDHIAADDPQAAFGIVSLVHEKLRLLSEQPRAGRARPDVFPEVVRVAHGRRDLPALFRD